MTAEAIRRYAEYQNEANLLAEAQSLGELWKGVKESMDMGLQHLAKVYSMALVKRLRGVGALRTIGG